MKSPTYPVFHTTTDTAVFSSQESDTDRFTASVVRRASGKLVASFQLNGISTMLIDPHFLPAAAQALLSAAEKWGEGSPSLPPVDPAP